MTDRELKEKVKTAFPIPPPEQKQKFLQALRLPKRRIGRLKFYLIQLGYIRKRIWTASFLLMASAVIAASFLEAELSNEIEGMKLIWCISAITPAMAVMVIIELYRSKTYGMSEIEISAKYNLAEIYMARTVFLSAGNVFLLLAALPFAARENRNMFFLTAVYLCVPYLLTTVLSLEIAHWCGKENLAAVSALTAVMISAAYFAVTGKYDIYSGRHTGIWLLAFLALSYLAGKEWLLAKRNLIEQMF